MTKKCFMYRMYSFVTKTVNNPWTNSDVENYKKYGSCRDRIIYNSKINARFVLESSADKSLYSCAIKLANGDFRNFTVAPITFHSFFIAIYIPELTALHNIGHNAVVDKILQKFPLLEKSIKSASIENGIDLSCNCKLMGDCIWCKVNAPLDHLLFPMYDNITNWEILDAYKLVCLIYDQIKKQINQFVKSTERAYEMLEKRYQYKIEELKRQRDKKIRDFLVRKGIRLGISAAIAAVTGGLVVDIGGVVDTFADLSEIAEIAEIGDLGDLFESVDFSYLDMTSLDVTEFETLDYDNIDVDNYTPSEYDDLSQQNNVSFGKTNCPPNASKDGYIYHSEIDYENYKVYKKDGNWWIYVGDDWKNVTETIKKIIGAKKK